MSKSIIAAASAALLLSACSQPSPAPTAGEAGTAAQDSATPALPADGATLLDQVVAGGATFGWLKTLKKLYPEEYAAAGKRLLEKLGDNPAESELKLQMTADLQPFMAARKAELSKAPDAALLRYLQLNTAVAERFLNEDPKACGDVFRGQLDPSAPRSDAVYEAMSAATNQLLIAAHEARAHPTSRADTRLTQADVQRWRAAMESRGMTEEDLALLNDPAQRAAATPRRACELRILMMKAAAEAPDLAAKVILSSQPRDAAPAR